MLRALIEGVLGVEVRVGGLRVNAALPDTWDHYTVKRIYRGAIYEITLQRGESKGCTVDGQAWTGEYLPIAAAGTTVQVIYTL